MRKLRRRLVTASTAVLLALAGVPAMAPGASATSPGGVFVTGHDPDFHALLGNTAGARNIIARAVEFVTFSAPNPRVLIVSSRMTPPAGHLNSVTGVRTVYPSAEVASAVVTGDSVDLATVDFADYHAVVVASDFGGILTQAELDILNTRSADLLAYVNNGGGLVALAESNLGAGLTPAGGHFGFLPFLATSIPANQSESGYTLTSFGTGMGLLTSDINGNFSHNVFDNTGGMQIVNLDASGRILSLATRGQRICPGGVPQASIDAVTLSEGDSGTTTSTFTVTLDVAPCGGSVMIDFATADGSATAGSDYLPASGTLTFGEGETSKTIDVAVLGDTAFEADEFFYVNLSNPVNASIAAAQGVGTVLNDDSPNGAPDCSAVGPDVTELWPPDHTLRTVSLSGATDPDGDAVTLSITGVTQDEQVNGGGDGDTAPDAAGLSGASVQLRAERAGTGDGRVYRIAFDGDDGNGGTCSGTVFVGVRHARPKAPVDSGATFNSFGG